MLVIPQVVFWVYGDIESRAHALEIKREYNSENEKNAIEIAEKFRYDQVFQNVTDLGFRSCYINESFVEDRSSRAEYYRDHPFSEHVWFDYLVDTVTVNGSMQLTMYSNATTISRFYAKEPTGHILFLYETELIYAMPTNGTYVIHQFPKGEVTSINLTIEDAIIVDIEAYFFQGSLGESRHQTIVLDQDLKVQLIFLFPKGNIA